MPEALQRGDYALDIRGIEFKEGRTHLSYVPAPRPFTPIQYIKKTLSTTKAISEIGSIFSDFALFEFSTIGCKLASRGLLVISAGRRLWHLSEKWEEGTTIKRVGLAGKLFSDVNKLFILTLRSFESCSLAKDLCCSVVPCALISSGVLSVALAALAVAKDLEKLFRGHQEQTALVVHIALTAGKVALLLLTCSNLVSGSVIIGLSVGMELGSYGHLWLKRHAVCVIVLEDLGPFEVLPPA